MSWPITRQLPSPLVPNITVYSFKALNIVTSSILHHVVQISFFPPRRVRSPDRPSLHRIHVAWAIEKEGKNRARTSEFVKMLYKQRGSVRWQVASLVTPPRKNHQEVVNACLVAISRFAHHRPHYLPPYAQPAHENPLSTNLPYSRPGF
jgi:hypothetical protein